MLKVMIVDDEPVAVRRIGALLRAMDGVTVVATAGNAMEALSQAEAQQPDLALLDIEMPGLNGMKLAERLRALTDPPDVVFVTAFGRFALDAFNIAAADYLVKPVEQARLAEAVERVRRKRTDRLKSARVDELEGLVARLRTFELGAGDADAIWLPDLRSTARIPIAEVLWMEAERDYVRVHVSDRSYLVRGRIGEFARKFADAGMLRVHRSTLVRIGSVVRFEHLGDRTYRLGFANGAAITASRRFALSVRMSLRRLTAGDGEPSNSETAASGGQSIL